MVRTIRNSLLLLGCVISIAANADVYLKYQKTTDAYSVSGKDVPASTSEATAWVGSKQACFVDGEGHRTILTFGTRTLVILNLQDKTFSTVKLDSVQSMINDAIEANTADAGEAAAMKAMMQSVMGMAGKGSMTVTKTAEQQKIGKWQCTKFLIDMDLIMGTTKSVSWMTDQIKIDPAVLNMAKNGLLAFLPGFGDIKKEIEKIKGVPVKTTSSATMMGTPVKSTEILLESAETAAPEGIYEIPKGFAEQSLLGK